jgi:RNA polymerase sigma-70 factor (ECF subfamily)
VRDKAERRILSALREGRREAYEAVIDAHYGSVYRFLVFLTREASLAEDLTQEVFIAAWQALGGFDGRASLRTWLYRIAYNAFIDAQRRRARQVVCVETLGRHRADDTCDPVSDSMTAEDVACVRKTLETLDAEDRSVLVLHYVEGLSYREMADVLDRPSGTIKWLTGRALGRLRQRLTGRT